MNPERPRLSSIEGGRDHNLDPNAEAEQVEELIFQHTQETPDNARWQIVGDNGRGKTGILYFLKPKDEDEFLAKQIARLLTHLGGNAQAEKII